MKAAAARMRYSHLSLVFRVVCEQTKLGQAIVVTGSSTRLGSWNPLQGLYLSTNANDFPIWRSEPIPVD